MLASLPRYLLLSCLVTLSLAVAVSRDASGQSREPVVAASTPVASTEEITDRFEIVEYRVQGNTRLDGRVIEAAIYPYLGPERSLADADQARQKLEQAYKDAGFLTVYVDIPEQELTNGIVRLAVTEARIGSLRVTGSRYYANGWIRAQLPEVAAGQVPLLASFNDELAAFNARSSDRSVTPVIRPGKEPGTAEMELKVADQLPLHGSATVTNQQTIGTSYDYRVSTDLRYSNLWQRDHAVSLGYETAPQEPDQYQSLSAAYTWRPDRSLTEFRLGVSRTETATVPATGFTVPGDGRSTIVRGSASRRLGGDSSSLGQVGALALEYRDYDDRLFCAPICVPAPLKYLKVGANWNAFLAGDKRSQTFGAGLNVGIRDAGSDSVEVEFTRFASRTNFFIVEGNYTLEQTLPGDLALALRLNTQLTPSTVLTKEQFSAGGNSSVRGYFESEILGDYGVFTSLELRSPNWGPRLWESLDELQVFGFTDVATVGLYDTLAGEDDGAQIGSVGLGLRVNTAIANLGLAWAYPYRDGAPRFSFSDPDARQATRKGDSRILLYLQSGF